MGRSLLGEAEASVQGRPGGPASRTGHAAHGGAAGTWPLSSLRQENKQKAGRLLVGTTGRFPWEKLPCSSPRWPCKSLHRVQAAPGPRAGAWRAGGRSGLGWTEPREPCGQLTTKAISVSNARLIADRLHRVSGFRNGGRGCTF